MSLFCDQAPALFEVVSVSASGETEMRCSPCACFMRFKSWATETLAGMSRTMGVGSSNCFFSFFLSRDCRWYSASCSRPSSSAARTLAKQRSAMRSNEPFPLAAGAMTLTMKLGACSSPSA